jgi:hypothetical protein
MGSVERALSYGATGATDCDRSVTWFWACGLSMPPATIDHGARPRHRVAHGRDQVKRSKKLGLEHTLMKPVTMAIIGALVVAVAVFGYLYYQRTRNDITIQMPKIELKP